VVLLLILVLGFGTPSLATEAPSPQEMAHLTETLLRGAAQDAQTLKTLTLSLSELPKRSLVSQNQVDAVLKLFKTPEESEKIAAAFFASQSLIKLTEASQILDTPAEQARAQETFELIEQFAESFDKKSDPKTISQNTQRISDSVKALSTEAGAQARTDLLTSVLLQATNYVRRLEEKKLTPPVGFDLSDAKNCLTNLAVLFEETQSENFDEHFLKTLRPLASKAKTLQEAVASWHEALKNSESPEPIDLASDSIRSELYETLRALQRSIPLIRKQLTNSSGVIDRSFLGRTSQALSNLSYIEKLLEGTSFRMRRLTDSVALERAWNARDQIKTLTLWALEATLSKSTTADEMSSVIGAALLRLGTPSKNNEPFLSPDELHRIHSALNTQNSENWVRAFVNREMAVVYAQSALLLGEAIMVPFTWGGSVAAMPTTLHAVAVGLQAVGKTSLILNSALNISDRYVQQGLKGLVNPLSTLDALTITLLLPRLPALAGWIHQASYFAVFGNAAFGAYQFAYAEQIAESLRFQGYQSSAAQIRQQALGHFAEAFLLGLCEWTHFSDATSSSSPLKSFTERLRYMALPHEVFKDTLKSLAPHLGAPLAGVVAALPTAGYLAYDYILANEALMYFFAGTDFGYFSHNQQEQEYPELKDQETAVTLIGFDKADMLYTGAHAIDSHHTELKKYGKQYFVYDYTSPDDLLNKLSQHAQQHGPIKYLRIMTHGLPGRLYTQAVSASSSEEGDRLELSERDGWIDQKWLRENASQIQKVAEKSMAPQARVVLFACLVGANLDSELPGIEKTAGEDFLRALGETFLIKEGLIDSSVRFLMGLDTIYGSLLNWSTRDEFLRTNESRQQQPLLPVSLFREESSGFFDKALLDPASFNSLLVDESETVDTLRYSISRLGRMLTQLHKLGYNYGLLLEGPWWSTPRYKHARVTAEGIEVSTH